MPVNHHHPRFEKGGKKKEREREKREKKEEKRNKARISLSIPLPGSKLNFTGSFLNLV